VGAECGQGFFHTLYYKRRSSPARKALAAAGLPGVKERIAVEVAQVDRCIWNYQTGVDCPRHFDCDLIRAHHKPTSAPLGRDCSKFKLRSKPPPATALLPRPPPARTPPARSCRVQCVKIGENCHCAKAVKSVSVTGVVQECEEKAMNPAGDKFRITFSGSVITATRYDPPGCWCDGDIHIECCIEPASQGGALRL